MTLHVQIVIMEHLIAAAPNEDSFDVEHKINKRGISKYAVSVTVCLS